MATLNVNGKQVSVDVEPEMPLLWVLRDELGLTGTKYACGIASCGACTVHVDGKPVRSCAMPVSALEGKKITTIEALSPDGTPSGAESLGAAAGAPVRVLPERMIMAAAALLAENKTPSDADIMRLLTNICRCGTYARVRPADPSRREIHVIGRSHDTSYSHRSSRLPGEERRSDGRPDAGRFACHCRRRRPRAPQADRK